MDNLIEIGKALKPHGLKGEVKMDIQDEYLEDFLQVKVIFIEHGSYPVPYFIEHIRGGQLIVGLEDVKDRDKAESISKKKVFIRKEDLIPEDEKVYDTGLEFTHCIGYHIHDKHQGVLGEIIDVLEYPQQEMALISFNDKDVMIPLVEAFIKEKNDNEKIIVVELPEGMLNL